MQQEHPLKTYRRENGLSQDALAANVLTTKATISRIENGLLWPTFGLLRRLNLKTGISADTFLAALPVAEEPQEAAE